MHRSFPHGHVAAALGALRKFGLDRVLGPAGNRCRDLVMAMVVMRLLSPASKLATARMLDAATASTSLGEVLELGDVDENELYTALDWLGARQEHVEKVLARKHLHDGTLLRLSVFARSAMGIGINRRRGGTSQFDPNVWSGRVSQEVFRSGGLRSCTNVLSSIAIGASLSGMSIRVTLLPSS